MANNSTITIEERDFSVKPKQLRSQGKIPATIYGKDFSPISVQLDTKTFQQAIKGDKTTTLELHQNGNRYNVLVKNVQQDNTTFEIQNVEFYKIKSGGKVKIQAPVAIIGEAPAVKLGGVLWNPVSEIEVECPSDKIPENIPVDISSLENFEDSISVDEIKYPEEVIPVSALDSLVIKINAPKTAKVAEQTSPDIDQLTQS